jgi:protein gp37
MAERTGISWTNHTFNIVWGCEEVSPACDNCYARTLSKLWGFDVWGPTKPRRLFGQKHWNEPLKWEKMAVRDGVKRLVFCSSMCDVFENHPDVIGELKKLWPLIRATPNLIWQLLTKRPARIKKFLPDDWGTGYPNVWLGTTIEDNAYTYRLNHLLAAPAVCHFVSYEPAVGPIDKLDYSSVDWVIFGGESGSGFRQHKPEWARDSLASCRKHGKAFFYKQGSSFRSGEDNTLDGKTYEEFPCGHVFSPIPAKAKDAKAAAAKAVKTKAANDEQERQDALAVLDKLAEGRVALPMLAE